MCAPMWVYLQYMHAMPMEAKGGLILLELELQEVVGTRNWPTRAEMLLTSEPSN